MVAVDYFAVGEDDDAAESLVEEGHSVDDY